MFTKFDKKSPSARGDFFGVAIPAALGGGAAKEH
ncbi:hypothetical protein IGB42_03313 [Andreprevotia sp. IGB-42]|nr:hypothetical protein IGB42_03313 [Andreprevotia sp. IGB-42]